MQLLDSEQLEYAFAAHGISRETQARQFYAGLWNLIQHAEKIHDDLALSRCEADMRQLCKDYFSLMHTWQREEAEKQEDADICDASHANAREAKRSLPLFEQNFVRYMLCYLELNRALIQVRGTLSKFARDYNIDDYPKTLKINNSTGILLQRAHRERHAIMEKRLRLEQALVLLRHTDPLMELLDEDLPRLMEQDGDHQITLFKGALRHLSFSKARAIAASWPFDWLRHTGETIIELAEKNSGILATNDGLMLHSRELRLIMMFLHSDEARINQFLAKYNIPYMVFQYQGLLHQGYLLGHIGSIEGLIVHHAKLLSLAARPHDDPVQARAQEQAILVPLRALLQGRFQTLSAIFDSMETALAILEKLFSQTRDYLAHTPLNSQN